MPKSFSNQIRDALRKCRKSRYRIFKETGISQPTLCRFANGGGGLSMAALDKLAENIGLQVVLVAEPAKKPRTKGK